MEPLSRIIRSLKVDGILITDLKNLRYLTGFTGSSGLGLFTKERRFFLTDFRYKDQSGREVKGCEIIIYKRRFPELKRLIERLSIKRLAFEPTITFEMLERLKGFPVRLVPLKRQILRLREIKTSVEIDRIKEAIKRAEEAFLKIKGLLRPGIGEMDIAVELEYQMKRLGSRNLPFEVIVASGINSSLPHARSSTKRLQEGELLLIDWGAEADGYYSDMTRTFIIGPLKKVQDSRFEEIKRIYMTVLEAQKRAISSIRPGVRACDVDRGARDYINKKGYGRYFGHSTGHGVGLDIHEFPHISMHSKEGLRPGMVFTVEPGIYISGVGGVRIEDMVLLTEKGYEVLTGLPRDLEVI